MTHDALTWCEIPVQDMDRAQRFYETLLGRPLRRQQLGPQLRAVFQHADDRIGGALLQGPGAPVPSTSGMVAYLNASPSLDRMLARAGELGAKVLLPKVKLPDDIGWIAHIADSEGNRVGLHSPTA
jgi:predicted enzyme related to lactoylglutathione lyase